MAAAPSSLSVKPKLFNQDQLKELARDVGLFKESPEILTSCFGEHGILDSGIKITFYHDRDDLLIRFSLWKMTLFIATFKACFQKWAFQSTTHMNGDCL